MQKQVTNCDLTLRVFEMDNHSFAAFYDILCLFKVEGWVPQKQGQNEGSLWLWDKNSGYTDRMI